MHGRIHVQGKREKPYDVTKGLYAEEENLYAVAQCAAICVEFRPVRQFAGSQDLGQPDSCKKANSRLGLNWAVCLMIPDFSVS